MFSESVGNLLQLLALGMEFVGISLAMIELKFPAIAAGVLTYQFGRHGIPKAGDPMGSGLWLTMSLKDMLMWRHTGKPVTFRRAAIPWLFVWMLVFSPMLIIGGIEGITTLPFSAFMLLLSTPLVLFVLGTVMIFGCSRLVVFSRKFVQDRSIGTLGLMIAFCGLLLELYQVATVALSDQPSIASAPLVLKFLVATGGLLLLIFALYLSSVVVRVVRKQKGSDTVLKIKHNLP